MTIAIKKITMAVRELMMSIAFNGNTEVIGDNGTGKTTLVDAIVWAFTGSTINGSAADLIGVGDTGSRATIYVEDEKGEHSYTRSISRNGDGSTSSSYTKDYIQVPTATTPVNLPAKTLAAMLYPMSFFEMSKADKEAVILGLTDEVVEIGDSKIALADLPKQIKDQQKAIAEDETAIAQLKYSIDEFKGYDASVISFDNMLRDYSYDWDKLLQDGFQTVLSSGGDVGNFVRYCQARQTFDERGATLEDMEKACKERNRMLELHQSFLEKCEAEYAEHFKRLVGIISDCGCDVILEKKGPKSVKSVFELAVRGIGVETLSKCERVQTAIWLAEAMHQISGVICPIIIDGLESVGHIVPPQDGAQLITTAYEANMPLAVVVDENTARAVDSTTLRRCSKARARKVEYV